MKNHYREGGVSVYIHKNFEFKIKNSINIKILALIVKILN